jgi:hypothetical protein
MNVKMRRELSISLIILFWLLPFAALLPGADEARLPACCRRHGAHHCAMGAEDSTTAHFSGPGRFLTAPSSCPRFPGFAPASTAAFALVQSPLPALHAQAHSPIAEQAAAHRSQPRTQADRGPPASS